MSGKSRMSRVRLGSSGCAGLFKMLPKQTAMTPMRSSFALLGLCPQILPALPAAIAEPIRNSRRLICPHLTRLNCIRPRDRRNFLGLVSGYMFRALLGFFRQRRQNQVPEPDRAVVALQLQRARLTFIRVVRDPR